ncbi:hypothetical protein L1047_04670 [Synechococcus sp. Nb3U1]|nr:hypothetical protein [Synechococcus sp. Nb3U1]
MALLDLLNSLGQQLQGPVYTAINQQPSAYSNGQNQAQNAEHGGERLR